MGYRFRFLRHVAAHVPSPGRFIRGDSGAVTVYEFIALPPPPLLIFFALPSFFTAPLPPLL
jgi:hypothetical protein